MNTQYKTESAYVASIIKAELKAKFPGIKFSVRSETFAGGDAVNVSYDKGSKAPVQKEVETVVNKYQAGHFDGMTDCYEYTNKTEGPTVKYVSVQANYPRSVYQVVSDKLGWTGSPEQYREELEKELIAQGF